MTQLIAAMIWDTSTAAVGGAGLDRDQLGVGGDAEEAVRGPDRVAGHPGVVAAGDDPGQVGAVTVGVPTDEIGVASLEGEVRPDRHVGLEQPVDVHHAGVDQRHLDALAGRSLVTDRRWSWPPWTATPGRWPG